MSIQDKFNRSNVIYKITKDIDLGGETLTIPEGCTLDFQGGSFRNGTIHGNGFTVNARLHCIFDNVKIKGNYKGSIYADWFKTLNDCIENVGELLAPVIYLTSKEYALNKPLYVYDGMSIIGVKSKDWGPEFATIIGLSSDFKSDDSGAIIVIGEESVTTRGVKLENFNVYGDGSHTVTPLLEGVKVSHRMCGLDVKGVYVYHCKKGFIIQNIWDSVFESCNTYVCGIGFSFENEISTTSLVFNKCVVYGGDTAFDINLPLLGCSFNNCAIDAVKIGFHFKSNGSISVNDLTIENFDTSAIIVDNDNLGLYMNNVGIYQPYLSDTGNYKQSTSHLIDIKAVGSFTLVSSKIDNSYYPLSGYVLNIEDNVNINRIAFLNCSIEDNIVPKKVKQCIHLAGLYGGIRTGGVTLQQQVMPISYEDSAYNRTMDISSNTVIIDTIGDSKTLNGVPMFRYNGPNKSIVEFINFGPYGVTFKAKEGNGVNINNDLYLYPKESVKFLYVEGEGFYLVKSATISEI